MKMSRKTIMLLLFTSMLFMLFLLWGNAETNSNQVIIALDPDYETFDPGRAYESTSPIVLCSVYDTLFKFKSNKMEPAKHLVKDYEISSNGKVYTFTLISGVNFTSGNTLTSEDVKWSFDRLKNLKGNPSFLTDNIDKVETINEKTLKIYLNEQDGAFLYKLTTMVFGILDSEVVKLHGGVSGVNAVTDDTANQWLTYNSAGSGPYILKKYAPNIEVVLERNSDYWKGSPAIEKVVLKDMPDSNTQSFMLQKGDIDLAYSLNADQVKLLEGKKGVEISLYQTLVFSFLLMNEDPEIGGPMANKDVQNAVRYALDYKGFQTIAGKGSITPISIIQQGFLGALPPRDPEYTNIEKAKELLTKAGYSNGFKVTLDTITHASCGVKWVTLAQKVKEDLSKIGIDVQIRTMESTVGFDEYRKGEQGFNIMAWGPDYMDSNNQLVFLPGEAVGLRANWKADANPKLVQLGKAALIEIDDQKRKVMLEEIQKIMAEDSPFAVLVQYPKQIAIRSGLKGAEYSEHTKIDLYNLSW